MVTSLIQAGDKPIYTLGVGAIANTWLFSVFNTSVFHIGV